MTFTVTRTISGKYSGQDHTGDLYFTDDEEVEVEYEYDVQDFIAFLFEMPDEYFEEEFITSLIENPDLLEELVEEEYANEFSYWLDKEREE